MWFTSPTPDETSQTKPVGGRKLQYEIKAFGDPGVHIFETDGNVLTARMQGVRVETDIENPNWYNALFQMLDTRNAEFIAVSDTALRQPERIEIIAPTDLATANHGADYLVVTHSKFLSAAERLAAWRATPGGGGYRTRVVTTDEIYNTFGGGAVSPKAIKAFLTHAYQSWAPPALSYVVFFGDGTFDFRGVDTEIHLEPPNSMVTFRRTTSERIHLVELPPITGTRLFQGTMSSPISTSGDSALKLSANRRLLSIKYWLMNRVHPVEIGVGRLSLSRTMK